MKLLWFLSLILSLSSFACPDLSGYFPNCESSSRFEIFSISNVTVLQAVDSLDGVANFQVLYNDPEGEHERRLIADGTWQPSTTTVGGGLAEIVEEKAFCEGDALVIETKMKAMGLPMKGREVYKKNAEGNLIAEVYLGKDLLNTSTCK